MYDCQGEGNGALYIPVGALVGASDLQSLANRGALSSLTITMKKHPAMLNPADEKLEAQCSKMLEEEKACLTSEDKSKLGEHILFEGVVYTYIVVCSCSMITIFFVNCSGSVRDLCPMAPNNVNTMACAAMAAHSIGFDNTVGKLVGDCRLTTHEIEILALGPVNSMGQQFKLHIHRSSPAPVGAVTSKATYGSFLESILKCHGLGPGVHFV